MRTPTAFETAVYQALRAVPAGRVTTYLALARRVGIRSPQAIGQALKRNPFAPEVPCHRVIASDLRLGGFNGATRGKELDRKRAMLAAEGVEFSPDGRLLDHQRLCP